MLGYPVAYAMARAPPPPASAAADAGDPAVLDLVPLARLRAGSGLGKCAGNGVIGCQILRWAMDFGGQAAGDDADRTSPSYVGIVYTYLPFMILPLYTTLVKLDHSLLEASADLGSRPWQTFLSVTLPLSMPGIVAGCDAGLHPGHRRVRHSLAARWHRTR
jgi:putrescine transport system permease protein